MRTHALLALALPVLWCATQASAEFIWDEAVDGDLSGNRFSPTHFNLTPGAPGIHSLRATTGGGLADIDYISITIPQGALFTELRLVSYAGSDGTAFIGMCEGPTFVVPPSGGPSEMMGWTHFGRGQGNVGQDILQQIGWGAGAIGFKAPVPAGSYSFWLFQLGAPTTYQFDFVVVPTPGSGAALLAAAAAAAVRRRRR